MSLFDVTVPAWDLSASPSGKQVRALLADPHRAERMGEAAQMISGR